MSDATDQEQKPGARDWFVLVFLFLFLRAGGLLLFHPVFSALFPIEEYYRGFLGTELLHGLSMPYWFYRPDNFAGGSLVVGVLAAGFFKCFGSSAFVLKMIPVLISLGGLCLWFTMIWQKVSRRCAWYFALFFIFAPIAYQAYSMVPFGDHYETIALSALAVWLFLKIPSASLRGHEVSEAISVHGLPRRHAFGAAPRNDDKVTAPVKKHGGLAMTAPILLGLLCGFGVWFAYIFALTVMTLLVLWVRRNPRLILTGEFWLFASGVLIGFSPWFLIQVQSHYSCLNIHGAPLWDYFLLPHQWTLKSFFLRDVLWLFLPPAGQWYPAFIDVKWLYAALLLLPVTGLFLLRLQQGDAPKLFAFKRMGELPLYFFIYAILLCSAVQWTRFEGERYLMPLMPAIFFGWARTIDLLKAFSSGVRKATRVLFVIPLLGLGGLLWASNISPSYAGYLLNAKGYAFDYLAAIPECDKIPSCVFIHEQVAAKYPFKDQKKIWASLAIRLAQGVSEGDLGSLAVVRKWPVASRPFPAAFFFQYGYYLFQRFDADFVKAVSVLQSLYAEESPEYQLAALGMVQNFGNYPLQEKLNVLHETPQKRSVMLRKYYRGVGIHYAFYWRKKGAGITQLYEMAQLYVRGWDDSERARFFEGMGFYLIQNIYFTPVATPKDYAAAKRLFLEKDKAAFFRGVGISEVVLRYFYPDIYRAWTYSFIRAEKDSAVLGWIQEGREEVEAPIRALSDNARPSERAILALSEGKTL